MRAHIDESTRSRVMVSGSWPFRSWPLRSLQQCTVAYGQVKCESNERSSDRRCLTHMRVMLPMHRKSPRAGGTVPASLVRVVVSGLKALVSAGAVIAHPILRHEAQLQDHGAPEAV
jgi:hypothetical protein